MGSLVPTSDSVSMTPTVPPFWYTTSPPLTSYSTLPRACVPEGVRRTPSSGSSDISTSASRLLVVASQPGNSMPATLRTRLRPPSHPTRYCRPQRPAVGQRDVHAGVVLRETGDLDAVVDRHIQLGDPAGEDALDVLLPQPEPIADAGWESR